MDHGGGSEMGFCCVRSAPGSLVWKSLAELVLTPDTQEKPGRRELGLGAAKSMPFGNFGRADYSGTPFKVELTLGRCGGRSPNSLLRIGRVSRGWLAGPGWLATVRTEFFKWPAANDK